MGLGPGCKLPYPFLSRSIKELTREEPAPAPFVGEMKNAAQFWADRVTKQFKETWVLVSRCDCAVQELTR
jgi:hypothetical protein